MQRPSPHSNFFSSLKQLEKRLKLDDPSQQEAVETPTQSLISPLYLNCDETSADSITSNTNIKESETPLRFLSNSSHFPLARETPSQINPTQVQERVGIVEADGNGVDEIELLMQLLGLSDRKSEGSKRVEMDLGCDDAFYGKIVGVKGPKSEKEVERLEGWIEHFLDKNSGEQRESFRLAHLLLGKAALIHSEVSDGIGSFEFPSTIDEFLHNDPPIDETIFSDRMHWHFGHCSLTRLKNALALFAPRLIINVKYS
ncbi:hypothetical protein HAX54_001388 [Datura stramonium]|uniref:Uncharacterized protein n=1 Tax=Datura stramonium TaxID=4076 RepID=A0ABS8WQP4_DATST|nr:hypothetical protein [Datura stramonium]